jgi:hypothetical protein
MRKLDFEKIVCGRLKARNSTACGSLRILRGSRLAPGYRASFLPSGRPSDGIEGKVLALEGP